MGVYWTLATVAILLVLTVLTLGALRWHGTKRRAVRLAAESVREQWGRFWGLAQELTKSAARPVRFLLEGAPVRDEPVRDRKAFEALIRKAAAWGLARAKASVGPFDIQWREGPTMWYLDGTLVVNPDALNTFTDADVVLATVHEIVGHHHQETRAGGGQNTMAQKEACAMRCEATLRGLSGPLVDRWRLMRTVRALIDLRVNHPKALAGKPGPDAVYRNFPVRMMAFEDVLDSVRKTPGSGLNYFGDDVGAECACR